MSGQGTRGRADDKETPRATRGCDRTSARRARRAHNAASWIRSSVTLSLRQEGSSSSLKAATKDSNASANWEWEVTNLGRGKLQHKPSARTAMWRSSAIGRLALFCSISSANAMGPLTSTDHESATEGQHHATCQSRRDGRPRHGSEWGAPKRAPRKQQDKSQAASARPARGGGGNARPQIEPQCGGPPVKRCRGRRLQTTSWREDQPQYTQRHGQARSKLSRHRERRTRGHANSRTQWAESQNACRLGSHGQGWPRELYAKATTSWRSRSKTATPAAERHPSSEAPLRKNDLNMMKRSLKSTKDRCSASALLRSSCRAPTQQPGGARAETMRSASASMHQCRAEGTRVRSRWWSSSGGASYGGAQASHDKPSQLRLKVRSRKTAAAAPLSMLHRAAVDATHCKEKAAHCTTLMRTNGSPATTTRPSARRMRSWKTFGGPRSSRKTAVRRSRSTSARSWRGLLSTLTRRDLQRRPERHAWVVRRGETCLQPTRDRGEACVREPRP